MARPLVRKPRVDLAPAIRDAAAGLFAERGFEATTMQNIADRVGVTGPGLYYYYSSKQALLFDVLYRGIEHALAVIGGAVAAARATSPGNATAALEAFVARHVAYQIEAASVGAVYGAAFYGSRHMFNALTEEQRVSLQKLQRQGLDLARGILEEGQATGEFRVPNLTQAALALIGMGEYVPTWYKVGGSLSAADVGQIYAEMALRLVGAMDPGGIPEAT
ncbi:MAG: TetR/AcrR family transcriptional regulator [Gemmatimonadales bacterium]|nr:TetR/AcrR family transcriptional regulator [Gemmatimonadales bacterium]